MGNHLPAPRPISSTSVSHNRLNGMEMKISSQASSQGYNLHIQPSTELWRSSSRYLQCIIIMRPGLYYENVKQWFNLLWLLNCALSLAFILGSELKASCLSSALFLWIGRPAHVEHAYRGTGYHLQHSVCISLRECFLLTSLWHLHLAANSARVNISHQVLIFVHWSLFVSGQAVVPVQSWAPYPGDSISIYTSTYMTLMTHMMAGWVNNSQDHIQCNNPQQRLNIWDSPTSL